MKDNLIIQPRSAFVLAFLLITCIAFLSETESVSAENHTNQVKEGIQDMKTLVTQ